MDDPLRQVALTDKEIFMAAIGHRLARLDQEVRRQEAAVRRNQEREERQQVVEVSDGSQGEHRSLGEQSEEGTASTQPSELEREDIRREKSKQLARKRKIKEDRIDAKVPYDMLRRLSPLLTSLGITHNNTAKVIAAFYKECDIDLSDVVLSVPSSKRIRSEENNFVSEKALRNLAAEVADKNIALTLHFDTKQLEQRMKVEREELEEGQVEDPQVGRMVRSTKDRLAVVVTGRELKGDHLVCVPGLQGGTAAEQVEAIHSALVQFNLAPYVASLVYDTTATNTGRHGGTVRLLQELLGDKALLCCECRR